MARFDVYKTENGEYLVDCQADLLSYMETRFAVPLIPPDRGLKVIQKLNPTFAIEGETFIFFAQYASAVSIRSLKEKIISLDKYDSVILGALDMLISGY